MHNIFVELETVLFGLSLRPLLYFNMRSAMSLERVPGCTGSSESWLLFQSKKGGKDQESIQSSTTPDPGYHMEK